VEHDARSRKDHEQDKASNDEAIGVGRPGRDRTLDEADKEADAAGYCDCGVQEVELEQSWSFCTSDVRGRAKRRNCQACGDATEADQQDCS
jgi:hypothetical protein